MDGGRGDPRPVLSHGSVRRGIADHVRRGGGQPVVAHDGKRKGEVAPRSRKQDQEGGGGEGSHPSLPSSRSRSTARASPPRSTTATTRWRGKSTSRRGLSSPTGRSPPTSSTPLSRRRTPTSSNTRGSI